MEGQHLSTEVPLHCCTTTCLRGLTWRQALKQPDSLVPLTRPDSVSISPRSCARCTAYSRQLLSALAWVLKATCSSTDRACARKRACDLRQ
jgi:hypothetical protein